MTSFNMEEIKRFNTKEMSFDEIHSYDVSKIDFKEVEKTTGISMYDEKFELFNIAADPETGFHVLEYLSKHPSPSIRDRVAWNQNTLTGTLDRLLLDEIDEVRGRSCF